MEAFDRLLGKVSMALAWTACAIIPCLFTLIVIDVSMRTIGYTPPLFTSSIVEYALLYVAMFSAPFLVREKGHVAIEALLTILPRAVQRILALFVYFTCTVAALFFAYFAWGLMSFAWDEGLLDIRGIDLPLWTQYLPMCIGFFLVGLEFLMYLLGMRHYYSYDLGEVKDGV
ncbi:MAG: TRAP transporter small permease subunit [Rhodospirillaceae bacterium]